MAHFHPGAEGYTLGGHPVQTALNDGFLQLHVGDAIHQQAAGPVLSLKNSDPVAPPVELVGAGQAGGAGAHHRNLLAGAGLGGTGGHQPPLPGVLYDAQLVFPDGDRISVEAAGTGRLAQGGTHPAGKLGEVVGFQQPLQSVGEVAGVDQIVPLGHQVVEGAAGHHATQYRPGLAEGHAARHTPGALPPAVVPAEPGVELVVVLNTLQGGLRGIPLALIFQKSRWFSHGYSPFWWVLT